MTTHWFTKIFVKEDKCFLFDDIEDEISLHTEIDESNFNYTTKDNTARSV